MLVRKAILSILRRWPLFNHEAVTVARVFDYFLPLGPYFLILNLRDAVLDRLHQIVLLLSLGQLERLLNDKVAVVVAHEGEEARCITDLSDENRTRIPITRLKALLNDA